MTFVDSVAAEIYRARMKHPTEIRSRHEGYGVLMEEMIEVQQVVFNDGNREHLREELVHVAAMAQRMAEDLSL